MSARTRGLNPSCFRQWFRRESSDLSGALGGNEAWNGQAGISPQAALAAAARAMDVCITGYFSFFPFSFSNRFIFGVVGKVEMGNCIKRKHSVCASH